MIAHRSVKNRMVEFLRGELPEADRRRMEEHLAGCERCRSELDAIREAGLLLDRHARRPSEQRGELYWQQFAVKVERRVDSAEERETSPSIVRQLLDAFVVHRAPFGIGFASALTLMMMMFGVWSLWLRTPVQQQLASEPAAEQSITLSQPAVQKVSAETRAQDYLEQSKVLLIGLMNTDVQSLSSFQPSFQREREVSRKLVSQSVELTASLNDPSQRRLKELIADLQLILVQIANLSTEHGTAGVEIIKGGLEHNDIIFKINLEEIQRTSKPAARNGATAKKTT